MTKPAQAQTTIRFPEDWLERIDAIAKALSKPWDEASRNDALRYIVAKGLEAAEHEMGIKSPKKPSAK